MPSLTFDGLGKARKAEILAAAHKEFSEHGLHDASVANIIKELKMPRGTFYKYFDDLEDLYIYFYQELHMDVHEDMIKSIQEAEGDLFAGLTVFFKGLVARFYDPEYQDYFRMLLLHTDYTTSVTLSNSVAAKHAAKAKNQNQHINEGMENTINRDLLTFKNKEEFENGMRMITAILHQLITDALLGKWSQEKLQETFDLQLALLKRGFAK